MGAMGEQLDEWGSGTTATSSTVRVLLYSDHVETRQAVLTAVGTRVARDLPPVQWVEAATGPAAVALVDAGGFDLLVLDGETGKTGGMGLCRQLKDEIFRCPPVLLLIARPQDGWLASWTGADAVVGRPFDPMDLATTMAGLLRPAAG